MNNVVQLQSNYKKVKELSDYPPIMTAQDVKEYLRVGTNAVYDILNHPKCPVFRFGKKILVKRDELGTFIDEVFLCAHR